MRLEATRWNFSPLRDVSKRPVEIPAHFETPRNESAESQCPPRCLETTRQNPNPLRDVSKPPVRIPAPFETSRCHPMKSKRASRRPDAPPQHSDGLPRALEPLGGAWTAAALSAFADSNMKNKPLATGCNRRKKAQRINEMPTMIGRNLWPNTC